MSTNRIKVEVNSLKEGMFIADLDRPWHETPFPLQGFYIRVDDDVKALSGYCKFVYVDVLKQKSKSSFEKHSKFNPDERRAQKKETHSDHQLIDLPPIVIKSPQTYNVQASIKKEVSRATKLHRHVYDAIDHVFSSIEHGGDVSAQETENVATGMVDSVLRNPDALVWLAKMNDEDAHSYQHSVKASIWALVFGRHLGLNKLMLKTLAMGVLLSHIGKAKVARNILENTDGFDGDELKSYQQYVQYGVELVSSMRDLGEGVSSVVEYHQERHNGTGYPKGITGDKIPMLAKIAGLVDFYQELIAPRNNTLGMSPLEAVSELYQLRNIAFQKDLVERFIEAVGVYPTGTLVELSSHEVGIVTGHNLDRRLQPKIMVVLDEYKQPLKSGKVIDLKERNLIKTQSRPLFIKESLPKGAYDIDENQYLLSGATSRWSWKHISGALAS